MKFVLGLAVGLILGYAEPACPSESNKRSMLLPFSGRTASLQDCDRAWNAEGKRRPQYAVVVNQTMCEPRQPCPYGGQVYFRTCYRKETR